MRWRSEKHGGSLGILVSLALLALTASPSYGDQPGYELQVPGELALILGEPADLELSIHPAQGHRVSDKGPLVITIELPANSGLHAKKTKLNHRDAVNPSSSAPAFRTQMRADDAGSHAVVVNVQFWLCRGEMCRPIEHEFTIAVTVRPPGKETENEPPAPAQSLWPAK